uniref:Uncharacterized protein n=1 Tax=Arundo donax TaxID=35708 RepID=A0A0A8ZJB7_ARUDO
MKHLITPTKIVPNHTAFVINNPPIFLCLTNASTRIYTTLLHKLVL